MKTPKVCVILLNWNGREDSLACLESLKLTAYSPMEVLVVDQGSQDGLSEVLRLSHPDVKLLTNERNLGFAHGSNQGIRWGLENGAGLVLLLNNDTIVDRQCIGELVRAAAANPRAGAVGPKILRLSEPGRIWSVGGIVDFTENVGRMRGYGQIDGGQFDRPAEVDFLSGCAVMVPKAVVETVGLLSEDFSPAYYEDADWGMRIRAAGYLNLVVPSARVWHKESASTGGEYNATAKYLMGHHAVLFMRKHAKWHQWAKWFLFAVLSLPAQYVVRSLQGKGAAVRAKAAGIWDGMLGNRLPSDPFLRQW